MKIFAYEVREDERESFEKMRREWKVELGMSEEVPSPETALLAEGCEGVTILGQGAIDGELLKIWRKAGVRFLSTRTMGYNHIDLEAAQREKIQVCNANYSPTFCIFQQRLCV